MVVSRGTYGGSDMKIEMDLGKMDKKMEMSLGLGKMGQHSDMKMNMNLDLGQ